MKTVSFDRSLATCKPHWLLQGHVLDHRFRLWLLATCGTISCIASAMENQVDIPLVTQMNRLPAPLNIPNWKQDALDYSQFIFDPSVTGASMPVVNVVGQDFAFPGYLQPLGVNGRTATDINSTEAMTSVAPVIAAELLGMDMKTYKGLDWVRSCKRWFNPGAGFRGLYSDGPNQSGSGGYLNPAIYGYWPMAIGMMLTDRHRNDPDFSANMTRQCASVLQIAHAYGCPTNPDFSWGQVYDLNARAVVNPGPSAGDNWVPGASSGLGWMLYMGYLWTGDSDYLACAQSALQFHNDYPGRYENAHQYGPLAVARLNAEQGMSLDLGRMMDNFFGDHTRMPSWVQSPTDGRNYSIWSVSRSWTPGGVQADGLDIAGRQDGGFGYAFTMGSYQNTAWLAPVVRYDQRYARNVGRFLLNAANSCRLLRGIDLDANHQAHRGWRDNLVYNGVNKGFLFSYEGFRSEPFYPDPSGATHAPYGTGDYLSNAGAGFGGSSNPAANYWSAKTGYNSFIPSQSNTDLSYFENSSYDIAMYMSNSMGFLGAIYNGSSEPGIIGWDVVTTDYFHPQCYSTRLFWNPYTTAKSVTFDFGSTPCDLYDTVSGVFMARNVQGNHTFSIGADQALVLVTTPVNGVVSQVGTKLRINGVVVDYRYHGNGLLGEYFNNASQTNRVLARTDAQVNFAWGSGSPAPSVSVGNFSARWSGWLVPQYNETYTLSTVSGNPVRLWVNDQLVIDRWTNPAASNSCQVTLTANQPVSIRVDFANATVSDSGIQLQWSSPSQSAGVIPSERFSPASGGGLQAEYFDSTNLTNLALVRPDSTIQYRWADDAPVSLFPSSNLSVRWTGLLIPKYTESHTLTLQANQGARLWVNNQLLSDTWNTQVQSSSVQVNLTKNQPVAVRLELLGSGKVATSQSYEAESAQLLGGASVANRSNASGGQAVSVNGSGKGVQFNSVIAATNLVIRYSCPYFLGGDCNIYANNVLLANKALSSTGGSTTFRSASLDLNIPAGTTLKIVYNNVSFNLDYISLSGSATNVSQSNASLMWSSPSQPSPEIVPAEQWLPPAGNGLAAEYFNNTSLTNLTLARTDAQVDFDWTGISPDPAIYSNQFSTRWNGWLLPRYGETYTLTTTTKDGVRLWINDQLLIDDWTSGLKTRTCQVALIAGQLAKLRMECFNSSGNGRAQLSWSSTSQAVEIIPQSQFVGTAVAPSPASTSSIPPNLPPLLVEISDQIISATNLLSIAASASDLDLPPQTLTYSLDAEAPSGASINPATGLFTWTPSVAQYPGSYQVTVTVADNGDPSLSASVTFKVMVTAPPPPPPLVTETDLSFTGGSFSPLVGTNLILNNPGDFSALNYFEASGGWSPINLTDGDIKGPGTVGNGTGFYSIITRGSVTYNLGGGTNDTGYTITSIRTLTSWSGGGRVRPNYTVDFSMDGVNFYPIATVNYLAPDYTQGANLCQGTDVALKVTTLNNVRSIRFTFPNTQQNGGVSYTELAVFGKSSGLTNVAPTQVVLSSSANPATPGTGVTFTATVQDNGTTASSATGKVTFLVDGSDVATSAIANGSASFTASLLAGGTHTITAVYSGNADYTTSANSLVQVIAQAPTATETGLSLTGGSFAAQGFNNLILGNAGTATLTTVTYNGTATNLTDGVLQAPGSPGTSSSIVMIKNGSVTYSLGNGSEGMGYTLTGIRSLTAWSNYTRINPKYTVSCSLDGVTFTSLASVNYTAPTGAKGTDVALAVSGATGVKFLRFTFPDSQQNSGVAYSELAAYGTATQSVPVSLSAQLLPPERTRALLNLNGLVTGHSYTIQSSPSLEAGSWSDEATFTATQSTAALTFAMGGSARKFFRLKY